MRRQFVIMEYTYYTSILCSILWENHIIWRYYLDLKPKYNIDDTKMHLFLRYCDRKPIVQDLVIMSKPSKRCYMGISKLFKTSGQFAGFYVVATPIGIYTTIELFFLPWSKRIGGEVLFKVYYF